MIAETERLILREMTPADAVEAFSLNNDPEVVRHTGDGPFPTVDAARSFLQSYPDYRMHGMGRWAVVHKADGQWLGWCGLKRHANGEVDLGFRFHRMHWGMGFATEAGQACLALGFGFCGLHRIIGQVDPANKASIRVLEKLGMRLWKTGPCGHVAEALVYRIDRDTYMEGKL